MLSSDAPDDSLASWLAQQARLLGLEDARSREASPGDLQTFARVVLGELAARGFLPDDLLDDTGVGCWSRLRSSAN